MPSAQLHNDVDRVSLDEILPYGENPKKHPEEQVEKIASSIRRFGFDQPIVVDSEGTIIKGHGRYQASKRLGLERVPVITQTDLSEAEARAARIADNRVAESEWDDDLLGLEVESLEDSDADLDLDILGFNDDELEELTSEISETAGSVEFDTDPGAEGEAGGTETTVEEEYSLTVHFRDQGARRDFIEQSPVEISATETPHLSRWYPPEDGLSDYDIRGTKSLAEIRQELAWNPEEYENRSEFWVRDRFTEIDALGYDFDRITDLDYWREKTKERWEAEDPQTREEIFEFYRTHDLYIPELSLWTFEGDKVNFMRYYYEWFCLNEQVDTVLDYGGGIGDVSLFLNQHTDAYYCDVGGALTEFYTKRMDARELRYPDPVIVDPDPDKTDLPQVDALVTNDVLEHVPDPPATAQRLVDAVSPGGYLATQWTFGDQEQTPCHIHGDASDTIDVFESECEQVYSTWNGVMRLWQKDSATSA